MVILTGCGILSTKGAYMFARISQLLAFSLGILLLSHAYSAAYAGQNDFSLKDLQGKTHTLEDYRGKWIIVNYWATWCPPCLDEIPDLVDFHERHKDKDAVVLGVNYEDIPAERLKQFVEDYFISYPILPMGKGVKPAQALLGPVPGMPTTYMVSPEGKVTARNVGPLTSSMIEKFITENSDKSKNKSSGKDTP